MLGSKFIPKYSTFAKQMFWQFSNTTSEVLIIFNSLEQRSEKVFPDYLNIFLIECRTILMQNCRALCSFGIIKYLSRSNDAETKMHQDHFTPAECVEQGRRKEFYVEDLWCSVQTISVKFANGSL